MRKVAGILVVVLVLGLAVSSAVSSGAFVSASKMVDSNSAYNEFWDILENESYLVYTLNVTHNLSAAPVLVKNSRRGEENAAEISALIWVARNELKASGVKTYYTADELRAMAQNISKNGLPEDTVKSLKEQGWTDDEIKALEDYIRKNADSITSGFDVLEFLKNFSRAFVRVGFRYANYETWALEKWKWFDSKNFNGVLPSNASINPLLADEWVDLYEAYSEGNTTKLLDAVNSLSSKMYGLLTSPSSFKGLSEDLTGGNIMLYYTTVTSAVFYRGGFVVIKTSSTRYDWNDLKRITSTTMYYWPAALKAYNLTRQIYTVAQAIELGNGNPELRWILNEKMDELKDSLKVYVSESTTETPIKRAPPVYIEPPHQPIGMQSRGGSGFSLPAAGTGTSARDTTTSRTPTEIELEALTPDNNEGKLTVSDVSVIVDSESSNSVRYRIKVTVEAENNVVNNVSVHLTDDTTGGSDSGSLGNIYEDSSTSWTSREFTASVTGDSIKIHGSVSITYTPSCGPAPTSTRGETVPATCNVPHTITESYSKTV